MSSNSQAIYVIVSLIRQIFIWHNTYTYLWVYHVQTSIKSFKSILKKIKKSVRLCMLMQHLPKRKTKARFPLLFIIFENFIVNSKIHKIHKHRKSIEQLVHCEVIACLPLVQHRCIYKYNNQPSVRCFDCIPYNSVIFRLFHLLI